MYDFEIFLREEHTSLRTLAFNIAQMAFDLGKENVIHGGKHELEELEKSIREFILECELNGIDMSSDPNHVYREVIHPLVNEILRQAK